MSEVLSSRSCNVCGSDTPLSGLVASKRYRGGYMPLCKGCRNEYWKKHRASSPEARARHTDNVRRSRLLSSYGITQADYERMLFDQDGKCKLCGIAKHGRKERFRYWNVDHDHKTGRVRGLLCHTCNIAIGKYENLVEKVGQQALNTYLSS